MRMSNTLTKQYYRDQVKFQKRQLETLYSLLDLNATQKQRLREITDALTEAIQKEMLAPEEPEL